MKKIIGIVTTIIILVGGIFFWLIDDSNVVAKSKEDVFENVNNFKPGVYKVEYDKADFRGWKAFFVMEIANDGSMSKVEYDYIRSDGQLKTKDVKYNEAMSSKNGIGPTQYVPRLAKNLQVFGNPDEVDNITGATHSCHDFKTFAKKAFQAAKEGKTGTIILAQPDPVAPIKSN